jgi:hypothetical protein
MPKLIEGWQAPSGTCPSCFKEVEGVAIRSAGGWQLMARCFCRHINDVHPWPFEEGIIEPDSVDFDPLGIHIEIDQGYLDILEEDREAYMDEVDHGWERSWY